MNTPLVQIRQGDRDIGWGKLGTVMPNETGTEITLHDVHMLEDVEFVISGPFRLTVQDDRYDKCVPVNFRNLRPGCDYDRVIFETARSPKLG